ncbi:MAG: hypothetical protein ACJAS1_005024 [Oleiphilaceae bacterium]|jgi:hypothetical protein
MSQTIINSHLKLYELCNETTQNEEFKRFLKSKTDRIKGHFVNDDPDNVFLSDEDKAFREVASIINGVVNSVETVKQQMASNEEEVSRLSKLSIQLSKEKEKIESSNQFWDEKQKKFDIKMDQSIESGVERFEELSTRFLSLCNKNDTVINTHSWMAEMLADLRKEMFDLVALELKTKKHPSFKGSEKVSEMSDQVRMHRREAKINEYNIRVYELLFPWLEDFKEVPSQVIVTKNENYTIDVGCSLGNRNAALSDIEKNLPEAKKNQLVLDRYIRSKKSKWEIGILYERYVAYTYVEDGWDVYMQGAIKGFEDMGRDIIAIKGGVTKIIQCKYWSQEKTIRENSIFQLFGTTVSYLIETVGEKLKRNNQFDLLVKHKVEPVFHTSTVLSSQANVCADILGVKIVDKEKLQPFPMIKCNLNSDHGKIYHLPVDQM